MWGRLFGGSSSSGSRAEAASTVTTPAEPAAATVPKPDAVPEAPYALDEYDALPEPPPSKSWPSACKPERRLLPQPCPPPGLPGLGMPDPKYIDRTTLETGSLRRVCERSEALTVEQKVEAWHDGEKGYRKATIVGVSLRDEDGERLYRVKFDHDGTCKPDLLRRDLSTADDQGLGEAVQARPKQDVPDAPPPLHSFSDYRYDNVGCVNGVSDEIQEMANLQGMHPQMGMLQQPWSGMMHPMPPQAWPHMSAANWPAMWDPTQIDEYCDQVESGLKQMRQQQYAQQLNSAPFAGQQQYAPNGMMLMPPMGVMPWMMPGVDPAAFAGVGPAGGSKQTTKQPKAQKASAAASNAVKKASEMQEEEKTTVMLRNLPNDYKRQDLLDLLNSHNFKGKYDFVYLPTDFKHFAGFGYAFINLINHEEAIKVKETFDNFKNWTVLSSKACDVKWGDPLQGKEAHIERYRNSPVMHPTDVPEEYKPMIFDENGDPLKFPAPTRRIRAPRIKRRASGMPHEEDDANDDDES